MWWTIPLAAAKKIPWKVYAFAGVLVIQVFLCYHFYNKGQDDIQQKWNATKEAGKAVGGKLKAKQNEVTATTITKYVYTEKVIREKGKVLTQLIPHYIPIDALDLPSGFRVLHDAAATGTLPGPTAGVEARPVPLAVATETITGNYSHCQVEKEKLRALWEWAENQRKASLELCKERGVTCTPDS